MARRSGRLTVALATLSLVATLGGYARPPAVQAATSPFTDIAGTTFEADIEWLFAEGITRGCTATTYCPDDPVTRGQMASFLVRMFHLPATTTDYFTDDNGTTHEQDIDRLAASGITVGCTATTFCPKANVRRDEMAAFLARAIPLTAGAGNNYFRDDDGTTHEDNIDRAAAAGITTGCGTWRYCIAASVTRGQMAGFLHRVVRPVTPPPYPAPGIATLYVATTGTDGGNPCLVKADPCRTLGYALGIALDGDTIEISLGTYAEEDLVVTHDVTITGDAGGVTTIDASGGGRYRIFTVPAGRTVTLEHLTLTGGRAGIGGAIMNAGVLTVSNLTASGNRAATAGGGIWNSGSLSLGDSAVVENTVAEGIYINRGGGIHSTEGDLTITGSSIGWNTAPSGGGLYINGGTAVVNDSEIAGNTASADVGSGGGLESLDATVSVTGSTISGNSASQSGGIQAVFGTLTIADSSVSGNAAVMIGGLHVAYGSLDLTGSTVSNNVASTYGGVAVGGPATIANSTIADNTATAGEVGGLEIRGATTIVNSTITGNHSFTQGGGIWLFSGEYLEVVNALVAGNVSGSGSDLFVAYGGVPTKLASIVGIPAGLTLADILDPAGLKDNGGPTQTIALTDSATNPARHLGDAATCAAVPVNGLDQRGMPRTPPCDIGAYELQP
jgi:hypothetical protein